MGGVVSGEWTLDGRRKAHQDQMVCGSVDKALPFPFPLPATNLARPCPNLRLTGFWEEPISTNLLDPVPARLHLTALT
jgi:hypothetical protein